MFYEIDTYIPPIPEVETFSHSPVHELTVRQFLVYVLGFSIFPVYSLAQGNLKWRLYLLS